MTRFWKASGLLGAGFVAGVIVATAGISVASLGKKGWDRISLDFKQGYVSGFVDAVRIAKTYDVHSYLAKQYRLPPKAKAIFWVKAVDDLYAEPESQQRTVTHLMAIAGPILEKRFGAEPAASAAGQLAALREAIEKADEAGDRKPEQESGEDGSADEAAARQKMVPGKTPVLVTGHQTAESATPEHRDVPGVKQRRRACIRLCYAKAEDERKAAALAREAKEAAQAEGGAAAAPVPGAPAASGEQEKQSAPGAK